MRMLGAWAVSSSRDRENKVSSAAGCWALDEERIGLLHSCYLLPAQELELSSAFWADALKLREQSQSLSPAAVELLD